MRVEYVPQILDGILEKKRQAKELGREIEAIFLEDDEYTALRGELEVAGLSEVEPPPTLEKFKERQEEGKANIFVYGVRIYLESVDIPASESLLSD